LGDPLLFVGLFRHGKRREVNLLPWKSTTFAELKLIG
jgi:hypothetical protein